MRRRLIEPAQHWGLQESDAENLFVRLSGLLRDVYKSPYVVLFDEYDKPLKAIRGQTWEKGAAETYMSLVSKIFKDNNNLKCGLLLGVYKLSLSDISSGANNMHFLPLAEQGYRSLSNELVDMFTFNESEVRALIAAGKRQYPRLSEHSTKAIMTTLTKWYDGYFLGGTGGKFNPYAVSMFLSVLERNTIKSAVHSYWLDTGNQQILEELALNNWTVFAGLTPRLVRDYNDGDKAKCGIYMTRQQNQTKEMSIQDAAVTVSSCYESLPRNSGPQYTGSHIVTMLIHTGYLTISTGSAVCIPNGELQKMWGRLRLLVSFGTNDFLMQNMERTQLYNDLYAGDICGILDSLQSVYNKLSNSADKYCDMPLSDIVRLYVIGKLEQPRFIQKGDTISSTDHLQQPDYATEQESGHGKLDWVIKFPATKENSRPFATIFKFKRVTSADNDSVNGPLRLARAGLEQIANRRYARSLNKYTRRLDIGVTIGLGKVSMWQRLWTRVEDTLVAALDRTRDDRDPLLLPSETVEEWDQRLVSADDAGWQDGLGWQTQSLEPSYRQ
ncbi:hypothetical protein GGI17_000899 [Coemansia sp. S146]|nr:hypothetical protein GGI17_000899 [Coemansia sp. S146]